jgi:hypothetical protein
MNQRGESGGLPRISLALKGSDVISNLSISHHFHALPHFSRLINPSRRRLKSRTIDRLADLDAIVSAANRCLPNDYLSWSYRYIEFKSVHTSLTTKPPQFQAKHTRSEI